VGADETTRLWANFTVENYNPEIMMGAAQVEEWHSSPSETTAGTNLSILLEPTSTQRYYDWQNPVPFDPSQWPDRAEMATHGVDAGAELMVGDMPDSGPASDLHGARLNTDAQAYTPPTVTDGSLQFNVAAPHCTVDAGGSDCEDEPENVNDDGFYEAVVPSSFVQNAWGDVDPSDLTGTYDSDGTSESLSLTVEQQADGDLFVRAEDLHYSEGTISLEPSSGGSGGGSSSTATPAPTATTTPTDTDSATPTATATPEPTPTATTAPAATSEPPSTATEAAPATSERGPGFGAITALAAIFGAASLVRRRP
jgi:PGF-CTERM protein